MNSEAFLENCNVLDVKICRAKDCISTTLDGETVILDASTGIYFELDIIGTFIWNKLELYVSISALRDEILASFEVSEESCMADLLDFLKNLNSNNLITIEGD